MQKLNIDFLKSIAKDFDLTITDEEAIKAHKEILESLEGHYYYHAAKIYFANYK